MELALSAISGKWTTLILRDLSRCDLSYGQLKQGLPTLSDKVLTDRLHTLIEQGLVTRRRTRGYPNRATYALTEAGKSIRPLLIELYATGRRLQAATGFRTRVR